VRLRQRVKALERERPRNVEIRFTWPLGNGLIDVGDEVMTEEEYDRYCAANNIKVIKLHWPDEVAGEKTKTD